MDRRPRFYFVAGFLTCVGAIVVVVLLLLASNPLATMMMFDDRSSEFREITTSRSPDGEYVATLYSMMGGGAAGWCQQRIDINRRDQPFDLKKAEKQPELVFSASCGSTVEMLWESPRRLRISYAIGDSGVSLYQMTMSRDKAVTITYTPR